MTAILSHDARTGEPDGQVATATSEAELNAACERAAAAFRPWSSTARVQRAQVLRAIADGLEADREAIVEVADRETGLGAVRLNGELTRTTFQLRHFADWIEEGSYLEATIDHAGPTGMGERPDLRRMLVPLGPVAVFGASNFPLAFSVPGGDTAAALAAGCPVVIKAHPAHPATSQRTFTALVSGAAAAGAPEGLLSLVFGLDAGRQLVLHPAIRAVGFTGSERGGRYLHDLAATRPEPIPFYGELSSMNSAVVAPVAASNRASAVGTGFAGSFTLGAGQFCTKPGLILVPAGPDGDRIRDAMLAALADRDPAVLLDTGIRDAYLDGTRRFAAHPATSTATELSDPQRWPVDAALIEVDASALDDSLLVECFGPVAVLARYADVDELLAVVGRLPAALTGTIHADDGDAELAAAVAELMVQRVGRLVWNGYPTGVAVSWAMQHGGPYPSSTSLHTSVGATSIRRFLRPVAWQGAPSAMLPAELLDGPVTVPRRVDGELVLASTGADHR